MDKAITKSSDYTEAKQIIWALQCLDGGLSENPMQAALNSMIEKGRIEHVIIPVKILQHGPDKCSVDLKNPDIKRFMSLNPSILK